MNKLLPTVLLTAALSVPTLTFAQMETSDNTRPSDVWHTEGLYLFNLTNGSANPVHVKNVPYDNLNDISLSYSKYDGSFRPVDAGLNGKIAAADIYGTKKFDRTFFEGSISYSSGSSNDMRWNGTVLTSDLNPFIIADTLRYDSLTNDQDREQFILKGALAYSFSEKLTVGLAATYNVANSADQSDPRLKANAARTALRPGIGYQITEHWSAGFSGQVELYHEDVGSSVEDNMIGEHCMLYIFKGLGTYEGHDALGYKRRYDGKKYGAFLQSSYSGKRMGDFTQISFEMNNEDAVDGGVSYQYKGGDFKQTAIGLSNRLMLTGGRLVHNVTLSAGMDKVSGTWYSQKQVKDEWMVNNFTVVSKDVVHKQNNLNAGLSYRLDVVDKGITDFTAKVNAAYSSADIRQYPDENYAVYSMLKTGMSLAKHFNGGKLKYEVTVSGGLDKALGKLDMTVSAPKPANKRFYNGYFLPKYSYLAADSFNAGLGASVVCPVRESLVRLSAKASYFKYQGQYGKLKDSDRLAATVSVGYTF